MTTLTNRIHVGRVVRFFAGYGGIDGTGAIVAVHGMPSNRLPDAGVIRFMHADQCEVDVILYDGRRLNRVHEVSIDRPGIGIKTTDEVDTDPARLLEVAAQYEADEAMRRVKARADFESREAARVIVDPPVFYWNGIKDAKKQPLQRAHYSMGQLINFPEGTITIYARDYDGFSSKVRACFSVENDTDTQVDYFDKDCIRVIPAHPLYPAAKAAHDAQQARYAKKYGKTAA
jgi:hypothetical protein